MVGKHKTCLKSSKCKSGSKLDPTASKRPGQKQNSLYLLQHQQKEKQPSIILISKNIVLVEGGLIAENHCRLRDVEASPISIKCGFFCFLAI